MFDGVKKNIMFALIHRPMHTYLIGGVFFYMLREYQVKKSYNYWFGKFEFERKLIEGKI